MIARRLGLVAYEPTWRAMQAFTAARTPETVDQLWLVEHPAVYTLGIAGRPEHVLDAGTTPVIRTDRGGQVTWHGPGQAVVYVLMDLRRAGFGVRELVRRLEQAVIETLAAYGVRGHRRDGMPGVYVDDAKIAAIGLRVSRGCTYHGVSLNVENDLAPFSRIDPCGYPGLESARLRDLGAADKMGVVQDRLAAAIATALLSPAPASAPVHA